MHYNLANLLVALAILTVISLSLIPLALVTGDAVEVEQAAQQLAQELQAVRQQAVAENLSYIVYFEWGNKSYVIKAAETPSKLRRIKLPRGVEWYGSFTESIIFYNSGRVNQCGTITLLEPKSGKEIKVTIASFSGRIRIQEED